MFVKADCVPCYLKVGISALRYAGLDEEKVNEVLCKSMDSVADLKLSATPGENTSKFLIRIAELIGNKDPFYTAKRESNKFAMSKSKSLEKLVDKAEDRLLTAFKISVSGNIIDMGINPDFDIDLALSEITGKDFDHSDYNEFRKMAAEAKNVLIVGDNCGEIVFDKILVRELQKIGLEVTFAVRKEPILNDATMEDAEEVGMTKLCRVVDTGSDYIGVEEQFCSPEFLTEYRKADIVISKGQANFESLESSALAGEKTFFVLRAKCDIVARCIGVPLGSIVLKKNTPSKGS